MEQKKPCVPHSISSINILYICLRCFLIKETKIRYSISILYIPPRSHLSLSRGSHCTEGNIYHLTHVVTRLIHIQQICIQKQHIIQCSVYFQALYRSVCYLLYLLSTSFKIYTCTFYSFISHCGHATNYLYISLLRDI